MKTYKDSMPDEYGWIVILTINDGGEKDAVIYEYDPAITYEEPGYVKSARTYRYGTAQIIAKLWAGDKKED